MREIMIEDNKCYHIYW